MNEQQEREAFEAAYRASAPHGNYLHDEVFARFPFGEYEDTDVGMAWSVWQARAALEQLRCDPAQGVPADLLRRLKVHGATHHTGDDERVTCTPEQAAMAILDVTGLDVEWAAPAQAQQARCPHCDDTGDVHSPTGEWRGECNQCPAAALHAFKNFHRLLCERFGYSHDEKDWQRDQLSLIEFIAARLAAKGVPADLEKAHEARRQAQSEVAYLKARLAGARLILMRELKEQGWVPPAPAQAQQAENAALRVALARVLTAYQVAADEASEAADELGKLAGIGASSGGAA